MCLVGVAYRPVYEPLSAGEIRQDHLYISGERSIRCRITGTGCPLLLTSRKKDSPVFLPTCYLASLHVVRVLELVFDCMEHTHTTICTQLLSCVSILALF